MSDVADENDKHVAGKLSPDPEAGTKMVSAPVPKVVELRKGIVAISLSDMFKKIVEESKQAKPVFGVATGHFRLDKWLCGLRRQFVTVLGATTSFGKTSKALQISDLAICKGQGVLYISGEDNESLCGRRFMARRAHVNALRLRANECNEQEVKAMEAAAAAAEPVPFFVNGIGVPVENLAVFIREHCKVHDTALIVVDYAQCFSSNKRTQDRRTEVTYVGKTFSDAIRNANAAGLLLSQIRRPEVGNRSKPPTMYDLKETGDLENSADQVLLGHIDDVEKTLDDGTILKRRFRKIQVAKNKDGPVFDDWLEMPFDETTASFREVYGETYETEADNRYDPGGWDNSD
jgi:replicative DNA helicase